MNRYAVLASVYIARSKGAVAGAVSDAAGAAVFHLQYLSLFVFLVLFCACCMCSVKMSCLRLGSTAARHSAVLDTAVRLAARGTLTINPRPAYGRPPSISPPSPLGSVCALLSYFFRAMPYR